MEEKQATYELQAIIQRNELAFLLKLLASVLVEAIGLRTDT